MTERMRRFLRPEEGAVTVEFVIIFPLVLLLFFLIVFASMGISTASDVQQVAHELARQSIGRLSRSAPVEDVCQDLASDTALMNHLVDQSLLLNPAKLAVQPCPTMPTADGFVTVTVTYNFAGSLVQALGKNFGLNLGIITRSSTVKL
ncbi:TadE/TadG family type IV pilus assembly protein [Pseudogemmobacter humi]|uniref:TadE-like protein n=1 Tax=Pseudogemmobacter humi TaxID=2483812 RepID=A0A3P5WI91_9RHOB|nr:TadE/TadG family type IV pilus assembly protein [Pseudogemmobacter humi]VDC21165.1 TadE-like protein [Pseudogemmobacter humi]